MEEPGASTQARLREADLERHLSNDRDKQAEKKSGTRAKPAATPPPGELPKPLELGSADDFQLVQALNFLKGAPVQGQPAKAVAETKSGS